MIIETKEIHVTSDGVNNENFVHITIVDEHTKEEAANYVALDDLKAIVAAFESLRQDARSMT